MSNPLLVVGAEFPYTDTFGGHWALSVQNNDQVNQHYLTLFAVCANIAQAAVVSHALSHFSIRAALRPSDH